ncbi:MAG: hypothetical protein Q9195_006232 [Heterodermia aff. obscurata]
MASLRSNLKLQGGLQGGQAAAGPPGPDPPKDPKKTTGHGEGDDDPDELCPCGKHYGKHVDVPQCKTCGSRHPGPCKQFCKNCNSNKHWTRHCPTKRRYQPPAASMNEQAVNAINNFSNILDRITSGTSRVSKPSRGGAGGRGGGGRGRGGRGRGRDRGGAFRRQLPQRRPKSKNDDGKAEEEEEEEEEEVEGEARGGRKDTHKRGPPEPEERMDTH